MTNNSTPILICLCVACTQLPLAAEESRFLGRSVEEWQREADGPPGQKKIEAAWVIAQLAGRTADQQTADPRAADLDKLLADGSPTVRYWGAMGYSLMGQKLQ